jgi:hypothetical protein
MRLPFLSLSVMAPPHLRLLSFWMNLMLCSLLLDHRTSFCLQEHLLAPPRLLLVPLVLLPVLLASVSWTRFLPRLYAPPRRPLRLCHAGHRHPRHLRHARPRPCHARPRRLLRPLRLRHARPRPHHPPPSATSRPHSVPAGVPRRLALATRTWFSATGACRHTGLLAPASPCASIYTGASSCTCAGTAA